MGSAHSRVRQVAREKGPVAPRFERPSPFCRVLSDAGAAASAAATRRCARFLWVCGEPESRAAGPLADGDGPGFGFLLLVREVRGRQRRRRGRVSGGGGAGVESSLCWGEGTGVGSPGRGWGFPVGAEGAFLFLKVF